MRNTAGVSNVELERSRFEIDVIDDEICALLERRFGVVERVRSAKSAQGRASPIRPAREFTILSRLVHRSNRIISADLKLRVWRIIMAASALSQAPVSIHVGQKIGKSVPLRLLIAEHYASIPVTVHGSDEQALAAVGRDGAGLCMVTPGSSWARAFLENVAGEARIIGCLPLLRAAALPDLLVLGHAEPEATGHDETIVIGNAKPGRTLAAWRVRAQDHYVTSYSGFHQSTDGLQTNPAGVAGELRIAGNTSRLEDSPP